MLTWFQNLIDPYPEAPPKTPPNTLAAFVWAFGTINLTKLRATNAAMANLN